MKKIVIFVVAIVLASIVACTVKSDEYAWWKTRWGMTPQEVESIVGKGNLRLNELQSSDGSIGIHYVANNKIDIDKFKFEGNFFFDKEAGLSEVELISHEDVKYSDSERVIVAIMRAEIYAEPFLERIIKDKRSFSLVQYKEKKDDVYGYCIWDYLFRNNSTLLHVSISSIPKSDEIRFTTIMKYSRLVGEKDIPEGRFGF